MKESAAGFCTKMVAPIRDSSRPALRQKGFSSFSTWIFFSDHVGGWKLHAVTMTLSRCNICFHLVLALFLIISKFVLLWIYSLHIFSVVFCPILKKSSVQSFSLCSSVYFTGIVNLKSPALYLCLPPIPHWCAGQFNAWFALFNIGLLPYLTPGFIALDSR